MNDFEQVLSDQLIVVINCSNESSSVWLFCFSLQDRLNYMTAPTKQLHKGGKKQVFRAVLPVCVCACNKVEIQWETCCLSVTGPNNHLMNLTALIPKKVGMLCKYNKIETEMSK